MGKVLLYYTLKGIGCPIGSLLMGYSVETVDSREKVYLLSQATFIYKIAPGGFTAPN